MLTPLCFVLLQVSALMLMVALCRGSFHDLRQASLHASLAARMSELVDIPPELRTMAEFFSTGNIELHRQSDLVQWPPLTAPPGQPFYKRLGQLYAFCQAQLKVVRQPQRRPRAPLSLRDGQCALSLLFIFVAATLLLMRLIVCCLLQDFPAVTTSAQVHDFVCLMQELNALRTRYGLLKYMPWE